MDNLIRDRIIDKLITHQKKLEDYNKRVSELIVMLSVDGAEEALDLRENILRDGEGLYLDFKKISQSISGNDSIPFYEKYGETVEFPTSIEYLGSDTWKIHLPPFSPLSTRRKKEGDGKFVYYLVFNLLQKYKDSLDPASDKMPRHLKKPMVIFEYHIEPGTRVFDFDNTDAKSAVDAMHGSFFEDDNAFCVDLAQTAVSDEEEYTDIYVMESPLAIKK